MSLWIEIRPPFKWRPKFETAGPFHGFLWGWFRFAYVTMDINEFVRGIARSGVSEHNVNQ